MNWILFIIYIGLCFMWGTYWIFIYYLDCAVFSVRYELNAFSNYVQASNSETSDCWLVLESGLLKNMSKSSDQCPGIFFVNKCFHTKCLYGGQNVCILSVCHEGSWLSSIECREASCIYIVFFWVWTPCGLVFGLWYFTGFLCFQLQCAFASVPTILAVHHNPWGLR